jgi:hypothetical protein
MPHAAVVGYPPALQTSHSISTHLMPLLNRSCSSVADAAGQLSDYAKKMIGCTLDPYSCFSGAQRRLSITRCSIMHSLHPQSMACDVRTVRVSAAHTVTEAALHCLQPASVPRSNLASSRRRVPHHDVLVALSERRSTWASLRSTKEQKHMPCACIKVILGSDTRECHNAAWYDVTCAVKMESAGRCYRWSWLLIAACHILLRQHQDISWAALATSLCMCAC